MQGAILAVSWYLVLQQAVNEWYSIPNWVVTVCLLLFIICLSVCPTNRHHTNPVGTEWRWKMDPAEKILQEAMEKHQNMIRQFRGWPFSRSHRQTWVVFFPVPPLHVTPCSSLPDYLFIYLSIRKHSSTRSTTSSTWTLCLLTIFNLLLITSRNLLCNEADWRSKCRCCRLLFCHALAILHHQSPLSHHTYAV